MRHTPAVGDSLRPRPARFSARRLTVMRVIGGADRGRRLKAPRGLRTRPTADRVRVTLFDILGPGIAGMRVLDLFAGTGAVGIEALSRGAARAVFVERDPDALRALRANLAALDLGRAEARVVAGDALAALPRLGEGEAPFDLVFLDPPYTGNLATRALAALAAGPLLHPRSRIVVQHLTKTPPVVPSGLVSAGTPRRFGETALTFFRAEGYTPSGSKPE
jgi:16S rRNA (guanine966-N2)-methyltransferase